MTCYDDAEAYPPLALALAHRSVLKDRLIVYSPFGPASEDFLRPLKLFSIEQDKYWQKDQDRSDEMHDERHSMSRRALPWLVKI